MPEAVSNSISAFIRASSLQTPESSHNVAFSTLVSEPIKETLNASRHKDHVIRSYLQGDVSLTEVTQAVHQARIDWMALQKISEKTIQALNDLIFKTGL